MISRETVDRCKNLIVDADAILIGAGAGLSASAGLLYSGKRFTDNFGDFIERYPLTDMYSTAFYPWRSEEEFWAFFSRYININRYVFEDKKVYPKLLKMVNSKPHFVLSTNADALFEKSGFNRDNIFAMQGDYSKFQCSKPCNNTLYENRDMVEQMVSQQIECKIPSELIPICPNCGEALAPHLRKDNSFVESSDWHKGYARYHSFIEKFKEKRVVLLELGVGFNTPGIIRFPFEQMASKLPYATLVRVNIDSVKAHHTIPETSTLISGDIAEFIESCSQ